MEIYRLLSAPEPWKSLAIANLREAHAEPNHFHAHYLIVAKPEEQDLLYEIEMKIQGIWVTFIRPATYQRILCIKEMQ